MKKLLFLTAAAAVAFSSCTKDLAEVASIESQDVVSITASMGDETRTYLDGGYRWSKGDALGVFVKGGVNNAKNVAFTLDPIYDGQKTGKFISNNTALLDAENEKFFAYYPHTPGMSATKVTDLNLKVLAEQNYQPGSFATLTAPSVADEFSLTESVTMQPVADYVKVYVNGVDDINYLTLAINYDNAWLDLTDVKLAKYNVVAKLADKYEDKDILDTRYALVPKSFEGTAAEIEGTPTVVDCDNPEHYKNFMGHVYHDWTTGCSGKVTVPGASVAVNPTSSIKLNCGRLDETVVCHNENEYVFVVPAGILRTQSAAVKVYIGVNYDVKDGIDLESGKCFAFDMSAQKDDKGNYVKTIGKAEEALETGVSLTQLENTVHSLNTAVKPIEYNPTGKFIIHNELDFLQYMNEYGVDANFIDGVNYGGLGFVDAYVCGPMEDARNNDVAADYKFDFSATHINELATSFKGEKATKEKLNKYVSDYIANGIPCIATYKNAFEANGATFEAIKGLQSENGMFGELKAGAKIENFILKNIKGAAKVEAPAHDYDPKAKNKAYAILASKVADTASIENIDIENASYANCILASGDVANVKEIEMVANEVLPYVVYNFSLEQDWTVAPEKYLVDQLFVFTTSRGNDYEVKDAKGNVVAKGHNIITVAESADAKATYAMFGKIDDTRGDANCVSVVINNESWWTNDTIAPAAKQADKKKPNYGYVEIAYAEQLKYGASNEPIALTRNMQMNGFDWGTAVVAPEINGNAKTINGITWTLKNDALTAVKNGIAPFDATTIAKLTIEGQTFNFVTDGTLKNNSVKVAMPTQIAGLTISAKDVQDVKINNFVIFAKDAADSESSLFDDVQPYYGDNNIPSIGWAVVNSTDGLFKNVEVNVTSSNVKGEAGLINTITLAQNPESQVTNVKANVTAMEQKALSAIEAYNVKKHNNVAGTPVFKLINNSEVARSIKFTECGTPALTYEQQKNANYGSKINVLNGNALVGTFDCFYTVEE